MSLEHIKWMVPYGDVNSGVLAVVLMCSLKRRQQIHRSLAGVIGKCFWEEFERHGDLVNSILLQTGAFLKEKVRNS